MRNFVKLAAILLIVLSACSKTETSVPEKTSANVNVPLDLSTPDKALKSYWAVRDSVRTKKSDLAIQARSSLEAAETQLAAVADGALAKEFSARFRQPETFSRDIIDVKVESESRAVIIVVIKNSTPIPTGGEMSKYDEERRENGKRYRYVLEKAQPGWRVSEIWEWDTYPTKDWKKSMPGNGKPYVPSLTSGGI
jgi:hypothetical protein